MPRAWLSVNLGTVRSCQIVLRDTVNRLSRLHRQLASTFHNGFKCVVHNALWDVVESVLVLCKSWRRRGQGVVHISESCSERQYHCFVSRAKDSSEVARSEMISERRGKEKYLDCRFRFGAVRLHKMCSWFYVITTRAATQRYAEYDSMGDASSTTKMYHSLSPSSPQSAPVALILYGRRQPCVRV